MNESNQPHDPPGPQADAENLPSQFGPLEWSVLEAIWNGGESDVREMQERLGQTLAYTTVMTTLDRLFKKGLLKRTKRDRAYRYAARFSREEWESRRAGLWVAGWLAKAQPSGELLVSCLVDALGEHDALLLDELERKIQAKRDEMERRKTR
jgi:predicted transcriptional regulator